MKKQIINEWFERGRADLEVAKILLAKDEYLDVAVFHIHQAVEKYLKGFLIYKGWKLKKIHDIESLLTEVINFDDEFQGCLDFSRKLTAFYYEERYPPGPVSSFSKKEIEKMLETAEDIINNLKGRIE